MLVFTSFALLFVFTRVYQYNNLLGEASSELEATPGLAMYSLSYIMYNIWIIIGIFNEYWLYILVLNILSVITAIINKRPPNSITKISNLLDYVITIAILLVIFTKGFV